MDMQGFVFIQKEETNPPADLNVSFVIRWQKLGKKNPFSPRTMFCFLKVTKMERLITDTQNSGHSSVPIVT